MPSLVWLKMVEILLIQCSWVQRACLGDKVKRQEIEENPTQEDKIIREEDIIEDTIDLSHIIVIEDLSHKTVERVTFTENIPN